jgi:hypothetical protein
MMDDDAGSGAIDHDITAIRSAIRKPCTGFAGTGVPRYISSPIAGHDERSGARGWTDS